MDRLLPEWEPVRSRGAGVVDVRALVVLYSERGALLPITNAICVLCEMTISHGPMISGSPSIWSGSGDRPLCRITM